MRRSPNAQLAVDLYKELQDRYSWNSESAWQGIARLLLSCEAYRTRWEPFHNVVTFVESNRFTKGNDRPHATLRRAEQLSSYLAAQLSVDRQELCENIGLYWRQSKIRQNQPHNLVGHAFRSLATTVLSLFGDSGITYEEGVDSSAEFLQHSIKGKSKSPKIDIIARRGNRIVAALAVSWRIRHNRLGVLRDSLSYAPAVQRHNPNCKIYVILGEFDGGRLRKVLANCAPILPHAAISSAVHFAPQLIQEGLRENGTLEYLRSLAWLVGETFRWG